MDFTVFSTNVLFWLRMPPCTWLTDLMRNRLRWEESLASGQMGSREEKPGCVRHKELISHILGEERLTGLVILQVACSWHPPLRPSAQGSISEQL